MAKSSSRKIARKAPLTPRRPAPGRNRKALPGNKALPGKAVAARKPAAAKAPRAAKWVYAFGGGKAEGRADMRNLLGGKGAGLAEMANLGLPVPPGFTITTEVCTHYTNANQYPENLREQVNAALARVGRLVGKSFGDRDNPLL